MLSKITTCGVGFVVAVAVFMALGALGRSQLREYVPSPAVRVLRSVPLVADVNGIRMPITVDMALKIGLSKPVTTTVTIGSPEPEVVAVSQPAATGATEQTAQETETQSGDAADYVVDELGIPYDIRIDENKGLDLAEWHAGRSSSSDVTFSAIFEGDKVGQWVTFDVTYYDDLGHSLAGVMDSSKESVFNPISKQTIFEFVCQDCVEALREAEFYSVDVR